MCIKIRHFKIKESKIFRGGGTAIHHVLPLATPSHPRKTRLTIQ